MAPRVSRGRLRVVAIAGSLRQGSYNRGLLAAGQQVAPANVCVEIADLADLPLYNRDVEAGGDPSPVALLKARIRAADALLIASPEYNRGITGVLKNAIDWLSRPPFASVLRRKHVVTIGATTGLGGTRRSQAQLRASLRASGAIVADDWQLFVADCATKFDSRGQLTDRATRACIADMLAGLGSLEAVSPIATTKMVTYA
jgi:chromate reductase, NAD(P)H dehydrogenase (quinone)